MPAVDLLGYLAGAFLLLMASMKSKAHMRMCNMAGNICFIAYGYLAGVMPVLMLNVAVMALHLYRIIQEHQHRQV